MLYLVFAILIDASATAFAANYIKDARGSAYPCLLFQAKLDNALAERFPPGRAN